MKWKMIEEWLKNRPKMPIVNNPIKIKTIYLKTACSGGGGEWKQIQTILSNWRLLSELLWEKLINWFWQLNYRLPWCCVKLNCEWMLLSSYWIGSFTIGIFRPFFNYFSIIFHFILFPFFLKIETQNERKMNAKWNPNLALQKWTPSGKNQRSTYWDVASVALVGP